MNSAPTRFTILARSATGRDRHVSNTAAEAASAASTSASVACGYICTTSPVAGSVTWYGGLWVMSRYSGHRASRGSAFNVVAPSHLWLVTKWSHPRSWKLSGI